jgi:hypothetical protein
MPLISTTNKLASAKRGAKERQGVHAWHPYYAGYSEAFVSSAIEYLGVNNSHVLLDPWPGSGTTAPVASRYKLPIIELEINPAMHLFANVKKLRAKLFFTHFVAHLDTYLRTQNI